MDSNKYKYNVGYVCVYLIAKLACVALKLRKQRPKDSPPFSGAP